MVPAIYGYFRIARVPKSRKVIRSDLKVAQGWLFWPLARRRRGTWLVLLAVICGVAAAVSLVLTV